MSPRRPLLRWAGWFALANGVLAALIGLRFLLVAPAPAGVLAILYTPLAFIGHFTSLAALVVAFAVLPVALLTGRRAWTFAVAVPVMAALLTLLVVDANVFVEQRFHLTPLTAALFEPATWVLVGVIGLIVLLFEVLLAVYVWRWVHGRPRRGGRWVAALLVLGWLGGQGIHIWADAIGDVAVTRLTRYLPVYYPIHAKRALARWGLVDQARVERARLLRATRTDDGGELDYPLRPLQCAAAERPPNILMVLIDGLRPDAVHPVLTPTLSALAAENHWFAQHWSGGNSSRAGIFSLFYGLPATYMRTFYGLQREPVLMGELRRRGYQLALFAAPGFGSPADIGRTVFAGTPGLPDERRSLKAVERNRAITAEWLGWLAQRDPARPFFGFLYYDPPAGLMSAAEDPALPMNERFTANPAAREAWTRYRRALQIIDTEVARSLGALDAAGLAGETIVIVSSDHGYEFDDSGLGIIGHASDYSAAQLRAPLILRWPGREPAAHRHRTSHHDLPVTLLEEALGCRGDPADYAVGRNLFAAHDWDWIIAGSYNSHAIVEPGRVVVTHPGGLVEILGPDARPLPDAAIDPRVVESALRDMRRFYR